MKNTRHFILIAGLLIALGQNAFAQAVKKIPADKQRATQWNPAKGQYYFSHAMVFDYQNKADRSSGKIKIYLDPVTGAMCFEKKSSFGEGGKNFDFLIAFPDGKYIYCGEEDGKKIRINEIVKQVKPNAEEQAEQKETFSTYCIPTGNKRTDFGLESTEYDFTYATSDTKDKVWLTKIPFSAYPLYGMEFIEGAVNLPVSFDYLHMLTPELLITEIDSKELTLKLVSLEKDPFLANTKGYQEIKLN